MVVLKVVHVNSSPFLYIVQSPVEELGRLRETN